MGSKSARRVTWSITGLSALLIAAGVLLGALAIAEGGKSTGLLSHQLTIPISGAVFAAMGALVLPRYPRHLIAWMLVGLGVVTGTEVLGIGLMAYMSLRAPGEIIPAPDLAHWLRQWIYIPRILIPITLLLLLFPDGKLPSRRWRPLAWATVIGIVGSTAVSAFTPGSRESLGGIIRNPFALQSQLMGPARMLSLGLLTFALLACPASIFVRFKKSKGIERQQLKWITYAVGAMLVLFVVTGAIYVAMSGKGLATELGFSIHNVATIGIAIAVSIAVLRYRLYDIDLLINRTLVYGALTACVVGLYVLVVGALGTFFEAQGSLLIALLATGLVAVVFQPLRDRLQHGVNRLIYGERDDPVEALSRLGRRLESAVPPEDVLPILVETIAQTLKLPYVAIQLPAQTEGRSAAEFGSPSQNTTDFPLDYQGESVGRLVIAPRTPGGSFSSTEMRLLRNIARQASAAVHAVQLTIDLQRSRQRLVTTREEERRRLRRDLHDGVGATLAALNLEVGVLKRAIRSDPESAESLADELRQDLRDSIDNIRHLVYELRPPTLDQLGLVEAIRSQARQCSRAEANGETSLEVMVEAPGTLPPLPAAVEVAAYRITQEALTNVVHHAQAQHCVVRLELADKFIVEVVDDGLGVGNGRSQVSGLGLLSMRERAGELGGTCLVEPVAGGGTRVLALLPMLEA